MVGITIAARIVGGPGLGIPDMRVIQSPLTAGYIGLHLF